MKSNLRAFDAIRAQEHLFGKSKQFDRPTRPSQICYLVFVLIFPLSYENELYISSHPKFDGYA